MIIMIYNKLKNLLLLGVLMKLPLCLNLKLMMLLVNLKTLLYLNIASKISIRILILLMILRKSSSSEKRFMFCRYQWKKKLLKLIALYMKKMRKSEEQGGRAG